MPTGIPFRDLRGRLFAAVRRVLRRDGPSALSSRAVTTEAGVAKGVLHRHFADFDAFLAAFVLARVERLDGQAAELRAAAGSGTVAGNVAAALSAALDSDALAIVALVTSRRELRARLRLTTPSGIPLLAETVRMLAGYLTAERGLGRMPLDADVDELALILVGAAQLQLADGPGDVDALRSLVAAVLAEPAMDAARRGPGH